MIDPLAAVSSAVAHGSPLAIAAIFSAGVVSSLGPCVAPRYLAVAGFASGSRRPTRAAAAFVTGLIGAYLVLGYTAGWLGSIRSLATIIDWIMAGALIVAGAIMLWRAEPSGKATCGRTHDMPAGAPLLLGAASAFVVSPCCTPMLVAIVSTASELGRPLAGAAILACFAIGHALPLFLVGTPAAFAGRIRLTGIAAQSLPVVGGALLLCLGAYYGALA
jgi:cytochrome c-type biogenesis protein